MQTGVPSPSIGRNVDPRWLTKTIETLAGRGEPLSEGVRHGLENGFQTDLSHVHLHLGPAADQIARAVEADAVTSGTDIFFREGMYRPESTEGFALLAHEVAHVVQQRRGVRAGSSRAGDVVIGSPFDRLEREAEQASVRLVRGLPAKLETGMAAKASASPRREAPLMLQCHSSFEHRALGDLHTADLVAISTNGANRSQILQNQISLMWNWHQNPLSVDEQDVQKLCPWIRTLRLGPGNLLVTYGEINALPDYLANPVALDTVDPGILLPILQVIRQESYNQLTQILTNKNPVVTFQDAACSPWSISLVNNIVETQALDSLTLRLGINSSDHYQGLLSRNACHFAPYSWYRWLASHTIARALAQQAYATKDSSERARLTQQAWIYHGYADHFLQDSFAAGHLLNKTLVMQWFIEWVAGESLLPVADWNQIKGMTTSLQPNLGGLPLYNSSFMGPSDDPQTTQENPTQIQRMLATGVQPAGQDLPTTYQNYLTFLSNAVTQVASANVHDYYNSNSLWVSSAAHPTPYEVWGDETLLTGANGGNGVQSTSQAAQTSQEALLDLLNTGSTGISIQSIRDQFPTSAGTSSSNVQNLQTFNTNQMRQFCTSTSFPGFVQYLKNLGMYLVAPRLGVVSRDQTLTNVWYANLVNAGYNPTSVLSYGGRVFAGSNGYVYEFDPTTGQLIHSLLVTGSIGVGDYTTQLATDGQTLFVGVHGYVYGVALTNWSQARWSVSVGGTSGVTQPVSVLASNGNLYAGANGYVYQINPSNGQLIHNLLLTSMFPGPGSYQTQLATDGQTLFAGVHGYVYGVSLSNWSQAKWEASLVNAGYNPASVLSYAGQLYAGSNGYVYQINPSNGQLIHSLLVTGSIGVGDYTTRLATDGQNLFVGVHGYVYGVALTNWARPTWNVSVGGTTGVTQPVSVLFFGGNLLAGANGYVYQISPSSGTVVSSVLLTSAFGVGNYDTSVGSGGPDLYVGTHGYAYKVLVQPNNAPTPWVWGVNTQQPSGQNNIYQGSPSWRSIAGHLTDLAIAADGTTWGVNASQPTSQNNVYHWNGSTWVNIPGYLTQISVGSVNQIWGVNTNIPSPQNNVFHWNGSTWVGVPGYLTCVAVASDGTIWGINAKQPTSQNNIYYWNGSTWVNVPGYLTQISVGSATQIWGVNANQPTSQNNIYYWNGGSWTGIPGYLTSVGAGADGTLWGVNGQQSSGQNNVYVWNAGTWVGIAGYLTQIAVGSAGQVWGVNASQPTSQNNIYQRIPSWQSIPGYLTDVAISEDGAIWGVNADQPTSQNNIYYWNGSTWINVPGFLTQISVGSATQIWGVNANQSTSQNNIYYWNGSTWVSVPGYLTCVAVASDGSIWGVNAKQPTSQSNICCWNGSTWNSIPGYLTQIAVGSASQVWGVNTDQPTNQNNVYLRTSGEWSGIPGYLTEVAVSPDGAVWGVNSKQPSGSNNIYRWSGNTWTPIPGYLTQISAAPASIR